MDHRKHLVPGTSSWTKPKILLAACGCVAANKFAHLCRTLNEWAEVRAVATEYALQFIDRDSIPRDIAFYTDDYEWSQWRQVGDNVLHIELAKWADAMVIAPLSANTLAKIAGGLCDNLLTCIVRAWDHEKTIFVAPSMNAAMWKNELTERHLMMADEFGVSLIPPVTQRQANGEYGKGAMAEVSEINSTLRLAWEKSKEKWQGIHK